MERQPQLPDVLDYMRCHRCRNPFIPTDVSSATASTFVTHATTFSRATTFFRCSYCQFSNCVSRDYSRPPPISPFQLLPTSPDKPRPAPASKLFIDSLKAVKLTISCPILEQLIKTGPCAVCSDEFKLSEEVNQLPCRHWFHTDCIIAWLNQKNNCPLCRHGFPNTDHSFQT